MIPQHYLPFKEEPLTFLHHLTLEYIHHFSLTIPMRDIKHFVGNIYIPPLIRTLWYMSGQYKRPSTSQAYQVINPSRSPLRSSRTYSTAPYHLGPFRSLTGQPHSMQPTHIVITEARRCSILSLSWALPRMYRTEPWSNYKTVLSHVIPNGATGKLREMKGAKLP